MTHGKISVTKRILALLLIAVLIIPNAVLTADAAEARASYYLNSYTSYICAMGDGELQIWFRVVGTRTMADIGTLRIMLYESTDQTNWTWVKTFRHTDYPEMLNHNYGFHMNYVTYEGTHGKYYKAYVTIWAGDEETGDSRYIWTPIELCT